jgi:Family of unknown function (DUF6504)
MTRLISPRHGDPVEVRRGDDAPEQFLWRGRLYVVRAVLARWTESGGWWRGVRALTTDATTDAAAGSVELDDRERDWWRVEADSGRLAAMSAGRGVYDLCFDWSHPSADSAWSLARVVD